MDALPPEARCGSYLPMHFLHGGKGSFVPTTLGVCVWVCVYSMSSMLTQVQPRRTTGWCPYWGRCSTAGHTERTQHGAWQAQANGAAMWRFNYLRDSAGPRSLVFDLSIAHDRFGGGQAATCCKTVCSHTPRTSMARCVLLRSVRATPMGNNTLAIRTFLFSPP